MWSFHLQEKSAESDPAEGSTWKNQNKDEEEDLKPPEGLENNDEEEEEDEFDEGDEEILTKSGESSRIFWFSHRTKGLFFFCDQKLPIETQKWAFDHGRFSFTLLSVEKVLQCHMISCSCLCPFWQQLK